MKKEKVAKELLDKAVLVGRLSPSGSDSQSTHSIVIQNEKALDDLARLAREEFAKMDIQPDTYIYFEEFHHRFENWQLRIPLWSAIPHRFSQQNRLWRQHRRFRDCCGEDDVRGKRM